MRRCVDKHQRARRVAPDADTGIDRTGVSVSMDASWQALIMHRHRQRCRSPLGSMLLVLVALSREPSPAVLHSWRCRTVRNGRSLLRASRLDDCLLHGVHVEAMSRGIRMHAAPRAAPASTTSGPVVTRPPAARPTMIAALPAHWPFTISFRMTAPPSVTPGPSVRWL